MIQKVTEAVHALIKHPKTNGYAMAYLIAYQQGHRDRTQVLYILNNITHLRDIKGETIIKDARNTLKEYTK